VLGAGMIAIQIGAMLMVLAHQNRYGDQGGPLRWLYAYSAGIALLMAATMVWEYTGFANSMHSVLFYRVCAIAFPVFLIGPARAGRLRWPATTVALVYMGLTAIMMWILPLFAARPMLAPIYNPVTYMQPPTFPLLLVAPAFAIDLLLKRFRDTPNWLLALPLAMAFVGAMVLVQWPFAEFLISPAARNPLFAGDHWSYTSRLGPWRYEFWDLERDAQGHWSLAKFCVGLLVAIAIAYVTSWRGLAYGRWMSKVQR
jgi:hypothetical protein